MFQSVSRHNGRAKHSSLQLTANSTAAIRCLRYLSNWFENHQPQRTQISTVTKRSFYSKFESNGVQCWLQPRVFQVYSFNSRRIQSIIQAFRLTRLLWWQKLPWFFQHFFKICGFRLVCHFFVLTTFWHHLWSITEQMHGNLESIC